MEPMPGAIESFIELTKYFETYVLSTAPWNNPTALSDKLLWTKNNLGEHPFKRLILTHHKNLNTGDYQIDDRSSLCSAPSHWSSPAQSEALLFFGVGVQVHGLISITGSVIIVWSPPDLPNAPS